MKLEDMGPGAVKGLGLDDESTCFKRKFRWLFKIEDISAEGINALAPQKSARPTITFKEIEAQHLTETIYYPGKPDWKPVALTLYDIKKNKHPIFEWLKTLYDPKDGTYVPSCLPGKESFKKHDAELELYDGCGNVIETWGFDHVWPNSIDFGDLDMASSDIVMCDLILRYDRAYFKREGQRGGGS